ncbi:MAG: hypothetical protein Udaeo2_26900 [Candidatus Udaeobacter sp.]|nr:MAG: hypothetical protein Udaeo2_26900 [Candidatus Udaeobacter sp.]
MANWHSLEGNGQRRRTAVGCQGPPGQAVERAQKFIPPSAKSEALPPFYSDKPAEVILFDGQPVYAQIPETQLTLRDEHNSVYSSIRHTAILHLTAGRWFLND